MPLLRADPWDPDFGMGFQAPVDEASAPRADPFVESPDWSTPLSPSDVPEPGELWFVDGVRRVDLRVLADEGERRVPGLFGSFAVGSVRSNGRATFEEHRICRAIVLGGGVVPDEVQARAGRDVFSFSPATEPGTDPDAPLLRLQHLMREAENALAAHLTLGGAPLVVVDGPLRLGEESGGRIVGVIKRFVRRYLEPEQEALLARLQAGQRTPVFALQDQAGATRGYSWYARLRNIAGPWHDHAGIVRCEARAGLGLDAVVGIADLLTVTLPRFAGRAADPRTPQNLAPIAALESWLRHRMGDRRIVRRALLTLLADEAA
ncbi:MAG TPA: hypothetical protein VF660_11145 [Actinomycetota bacterium]|jgi:hypothetical protein